MAASTVRCVVTRSSGGNPGPKMTGPANGFRPALGDLRRFLEGHRNRVGQPECGYAALRRQGLNL